MLSVIRTVFGFGGTIDRRSFALVGVVAMALKFGIDAIVAGVFFHVNWTWRSYLDPLGVRFSALTPSESQTRFLITMLAISLPFASLGVALTARRVRACGLSPWLVILFFVPFVNLVFFVALLVLPDRVAREAEAKAFLPVDRIGNAAAAVAVTALLGLVTLVLGSRIVSEYGWGLFVAAPFTQGALAAYLYGIRTPRSLKSSIGVALASVAVAGGCMLLFAFEGGLCIAMAFPLAAAFAVIGALFGHQLQRRIPRGGIAASTIFCLLLASPAIMGAGTVVPREASTFAVTTTIVVDAPPAVVWHRVVSFPELAPPTEPEFRLGVAFPIRARIIGHGVGAVRYCEFSTGPFVEPITTWDRNRRLAFRVASNPEPMQEWSPFAHIDPPHLHGYMQSLHGQFVLEALPGGRTKLSGTTWYRHHLWPEAYWRLWSDAIVHDIHRRVLSHIGTLAERDARAN